MENVLSVRAGSRLDTQKTNWPVVAFWCLVAVAIAVMFTVCPVFATIDDQIAEATSGSTSSAWTSIKSAINDIYGQFVAISTVVAAVSACIALLMRMLSRNQRVVEESTQWLKRIVVAWILMNSLGFVANYLSTFSFVGNTSL